MRGKRLCASLYDAMHDVRFCIVQAADFEREFLRVPSSFAEFRAVKDFGPDLIVGRLGENVSSERVQKGKFTQTYKRLLDYCRRKDTKLILTTCFWESPVVDDEIRALAKSEGCALAELNDLGARDEMKACGLFSHTASPRIPATGNAGDRRTNFTGHGEIAMRKRINTLNASLLLNGVSYGEHVMNPGTVVEDVEKLVRNCSNTFIVRCQPDRPMTDETYCALAKFAKEKNLHFGFLYAYQFPPKGKRSHLNAALVQKLDELAGDLFLGEFFGEAGSDKAAKDKGYYVEGSEVIALQMPPQDFNDMLAAKENFVRFIRSMTAYDDEIGLKKTFLVEATALSRYEMEGGIRTPILEVLPGNPENLIPFTRGAAIGYGRENWGGFIANEWYGGYRHEDELKRARLELTYKYLYLSGANLTFLESGNHEIKSFGYDLDENSDLCRSYRAAAENFENFIENNPRPPCGPLAKVAFLAGNADGYTDFMGRQQLVPVRTRNVGQRRRRKELGYFIRNIPLPRLARSVGICR